MDSSDIDAAAVVLNDCELPPIAARARLAAAVHQAVNQETNLSNLDTRIVYTMIGAMVATRLFNRIYKICIGRVECVDERYRHAQDISKAMMSYHIWLTADHSSDTELVDFSAWYCSSGEKHSNIPSMLINQRRVIWTWEDSISSSIILQHDPALNRVFLNAFGKISFQQSSRMFNRALAKYIHALRSS